MGPRRRAPAVRRAGVPRAARAPVRHADRAPSRRPRRASRSRAARSSPAPCGPGSTRTPATDAGSGSSCTGSWAPGRGRDVEGIAFAAGEPSLEARAAGASAGCRTGGLPRRAARCCRTTRRRWGSGSPTRRCPRPRTTSRRRCTRCAPAAGRSRGLTSDTALAAYLARPGQRTLRPGRPRAALPAPGAARRERAGRRPALAARRRGGGRRRARPGSRCWRRPRCQELADALDAELAERGGSELLAELELPLAFVLADLETAGIAVDHEALSALEAEFARAVKQAAQDAYGVIGKEINLGSPKQLQVVLFDELEHAEDQAHEDRLHHRRRRAADPVRADRARVPVAPAGAPRRDPAQGHGGGAAQVRRRRRPHPHHVQPDDRRHRAAVLHRAEPAERADPHGGGAADPRHVRRRP